MEKKDFYDVSNYADKLDPGLEVTLRHTLYFCPEKADISPFVKLPLDELRDLRDKSVTMEQEVFEELKELLSKWELFGATTMLFDRSIQYLMTPAVEHTANKWVRNIDDFDEISNKVYKMTVHIEEEKHYDRDAGKSVPVAWHVKWGVHLNTPDRLGAVIAGRNYKRYTDKAAAMKYIEGRKKAYAHLFTEINPPTPPEYAHQFTKNGLLLPGYTVEGQELVPSEHTADEISGSSIGGILGVNEGKPSVREQLKAQQTQKQENPAPHKNVKKSEPEI